MMIADMNFLQVEEYVKKGGNRCVIPVGSTEQHGYLSLATDSILAERVSKEAAEPLGVPVFPVMPFGLAPTFAAYPGTVILRVETLLAVMRDVVASAYRSGFRHIVIVNGHGGNAPVGNLATELMMEHADLAIRFHNWWNAPKTWAKVQAIDSTGSHANWMENFPWTRLANVAMPSHEKPMFDRELMRVSSPDLSRKVMGDGVFGGVYQKPDAEMLALWKVGVEETREAIEGPWPTRS